MPSAWPLQPQVACCTPAAQVLLQKLAAWVEYQAPAAVGMTQLISVQSLQSCTLLTWELLSTSLSIEHELGMARAEGQCMMHTLMH